MEKLTIEQLEILVALLDGQILALKHTKMLGYILKLQCELDEREEKNENK